MKRMLPAVLPALLLCASTARADGSPPARCELKVVNALPGNDGIDPAITRLRRWLQAPPYSSWHTFKLLSDNDKELAPGGSVTFPLPTGKPATVTYLEHLKTGKHAVRVGLKIETPRGASVNTGIKLDEGGLYMVAGQPWNGGILIYSLSCKTED